MMTFALLLTLATSSPDPFLKKAEELMDDAEYERAQKVVRKGLAREGLDRAVLVELYLQEATCLATLGKKRQARSSFAKLLTVDPGFVAGRNVSPKVRVLFEETRDAVARAGNLDSVYEPLHTPIGTRSPEQPARAELRFGNHARADDVSRVVLYARRLGTNDFAAIDATRAAGDDAAFAAEIPKYLMPNEAEAYAMEYYLEAFSSSGLRLAGVGNADLPLSFLVVPAAELRGDVLADDFSTIPLIAVGAGAAVALAAVAAIGGGVALFFYVQAQNPTGAATVTVRQVN